MLILKNAVRFNRLHAFQKILSSTHRHISCYSGSGGPFRILFCGSDEFSITSLQHLHQELNRNASSIQSIDVACRQGKPAGRGLKNIRDVPIKNAAAALQLPVHEISTFAEWDFLQEMKHINLIIAVSFGLFIPARILANMAYGGLNVHPSLLPDLYGPAPLQHTILQGRKETGVTIQTLSDTKFDGGHIISQQAMSVPMDGECTFEQLRDALALRGAHMLVKTLRNEKVSGPDLYKTNSTASAPIAASHARKLNSADRQVDWRVWTGDRVLRTQRAIGPVWSFLETKCGPQKKLRCQWYNFRVLQPSRVERMQALPLQESISQISEDHEGLIPTYSIVIRTADGLYLEPEAVTIEGRPKKEKPIAILNII